MYPPLTTITRVCTKPYKIPDTEIVIETGTIVDIPVVGIHYDRQYYPNPEQFNPDNFSERNKNSRPPYTFLAFGEGQKICIGNNFLSNISKIHARSLCYDDKYWWQNSLFYFYFLFFTQP